MLSPDRLKRQPSANTTPQSTTSFDPIDPDEEARQRTDDMEEEEEVTEAVGKKEKAGKNLVVAVILVLVRNSQCISKHCSKQNCSFYSQMVAN
jgi:hypothetical protein